MVEAVPVLTRLVVLDVAKVALYVCYPVVPAKQVTECGESQAAGQQKRQLRQCQHRGSGALKGAHQCTGIARASATSIPLHEGENCENEVFFVGVP